MTGTAMRALAWLQWRLFVNGLRGGRRRDTLERTSRWLEVLTPAVKTALAIPLVLLLVAAGALAGFALGRGADGHGTVEAIVVIVLTFPLALVAVRPIFLAERGSLERTDLVRLLPIARSLLFNLEFVRAAADPVVLLFVPPLFAVACGALVAGAARVALVAVAAGIAFLLVLVGVGGLVVIAAQLFLRDRRRAEAAALALAVGVIVVSFLPQIVARPRPVRGTVRSVPAPPSGRSAGGVAAQSGGRVTAPTALRFLPSSVYAAALGHAASGRMLASAGGIGVLAVVAASCYGLAVPLQRRLLETPARSVRSARAPSAATWGVPFVSAETAAVAAVQLRTALRTLRGRVGLLTAPLQGAFFAVMFSRASADTPMGVLGTPLAVTVIVVLVALQSLAPVSVNQFASDGRGLPLLFLQPLSARSLVRGKAIGIGALQLACLVLAIVPMAALARGATPSLILAGFLGGLAAAVALAPVAAALSALLPKRVDLARWGRSSNPHATAGLVNFVTTGLTGAPLVGAELLASLVLHRAWLAPVLMTNWLVIAGAAAWLAFPIAERVVVARRENLALVVLND